MPKHNYQPSVPKTKNLRDLGRSLSAQDVMRQEMEANVNKDVDRIIRDDSRGVMSLGDVFDEFMPQPVVSRPIDSPVQGNVTALALQLIDEAPNLQLSLGQWAIVQELVERGIRTGHRMGTAITG